MRLILAALAIAGAIDLAHAQLGDGDRFAAMSAADVVRAVRCAPPKVCRAPARRPRPAIDGGLMLALVDQAAAAQGVPAAIARALVRVESNFNPRAVNDGALGLTQIKCRTARGLGFDGPCAALFDPATNLRWGLNHAARAIARGSIGFHQTGLHARGVTRGYVAKIRNAMEGGR